MPRTYVADTSPIDIDIVDDDGVAKDLSATGFDADLPNSLSFVRKLGGTADLFSKAPIVNPNGSLSGGNIRVEITKTDFVSGSAGSYYVWSVLNDQAGVDQLTHSSESFEVKENP